MRAIPAVRNLPAMASVFASNPHMLYVKPSLTRFMCSYMNKFKVRKAGHNLILHSHLPPLNSKAYSRFVDLHLISRTAGPSHAQISVTNLCPQNCSYCYNKGRDGKVIDTDTIIHVATELKEVGMVWFGITGGEPLLNRNIIKIVEAVSEDCAVKLFTTGCALTRDRAAGLRDAGLFSVSVSLDHWDEKVHDSVRGYRGAFREALKAIEVFKELGDIDVGISAVLSRDMIRSGGTEQFLKFLEGLGISEAWLSEVKPSAGIVRDDRCVITEEDRLKLVRLQDGYNASGKMTVNYLGHFEGKECFGCNAANKMVYVDAFGEVSPCVFTPMSFGNVHELDITALFAKMKSCFPSDSKCFINKNYRLFGRHSNGKKVLGPEESLRLMDEVEFGERAAFFKLYYDREDSDGIGPVGRYKSEA